MNRCYPQLNASKVQRIAYLLGFLTMLFTFLQVHAQKPVGQLWGTRIHDDANILSTKTVDELEKQLAAYEDSTSNQIAILTVSSLDGEPVENYSMRVVEEWKLGTEGKDNGVLLLIAINDRKMRIEVGYGLEGVLTDAISSRIIRNELAPAFRQNQYDQGVTDAVNSIISAIGGEYKAEESDEELEIGIIPRILISLFIFTILGAFTFMGLIVPGCGGWFLYVFLIPFYAVFPMVVLGPIIAIAVTVVYIIGFPILKLILNKTGWTKKLEKKMSSAGSRGGGWSSGSGWSSGRSSGGSSSSFSGGGGSFGGGGSSGSW